MRESLACSLGNTNFRDPEVSEKSMSVTKPPSKKAVAARAADKPQKPAEAPSPRVAKHERRIAWVDSALEKAP